MDIKHWYLYNGRYREPNRFDGEQIGYLIEDDGSDIYIWVEWAFTHQIEFHIGKAAIAQEILMLRDAIAWQPEPKFKTRDSIKAYIETLPKWDKSKYFLSGFGAITFKDCRTSMALNAEEQVRINDQYNIPKYRKPEENRDAT